MSPRQVVHVRVSCNVPDAGLSGVSCPPVPGSSLGVSGVGSLSSFPQAEKVMVMTLAASIMAKKYNFFMRTIFLG